MPILVALTDVSWATANYKAGDEFEVNDAFAHLLRLSGKVRDKDAPAPKQEVLNTKDQVAEEDNKAATRRANRYPRRDMRAQED